MKKISSKIIISLLLAMVLWGGAGLFFLDYNTNKQSSEIVSINLAHAQSEGGLIDVETKKGGEKMSIWEKFKSGGLFLLDVSTGIAASPVFKTLQSLLYILVILQSFLVVAAAAVFDGMMILSIEKFPEILGNSGVEIAWSIFRNIINISFIFVLLYISISIILGNIGPRAKSTIAKVIVAAVLINFSLFFTKVLVDASNIFAVALYNYTSGSIGTFTGTVMNALEIQSLWSWKNITATGQTNTLFLLLLQFILLFILTWTYLKAAFMFLGRMIMLIILMSLSPIAFLNDAIPGISGKASEWWSAFIGQLMVAPAFIFILIIVSELLKKKEEINALTGGLFNVNSTYTGNFSVGPLIYYIIVIGILSAGIKLVKELSGVVGGIAEKLAKALVAAIVIAVTGGAAVATRAAGVGAGTVLKNVVTGDIKNTTGVSGIAGRFTRSKFMETTKDISYGKIDLKKIEKTYQQARKDEEERIMKGAEAVGPQKAIDAKKRFTDIQENINQQISPDLIKKSAESNEKIKNLEEKVKEADKKIAEAMKEKEAAKDRTAYELAEQKIAGITKEKGELENKLDSTRSDNSLIIKELTDARENIALSMGTTMTAIKEGIDKANKDIVIGTQKKNEFALNLEKGNIITTGFFEKGRKDLANKVRAQQGKYKGDKDIRKQLEQLMKDQGIKIEDESIDDKKPETKSEPK